MACEAQPHALMTPPSSGTLRPLLQVCALASEASQSPVVGPLSQPSLLVPSVSLQQIQRAGLARKVPRREVSAKSLD